MNEIQSEQPTVFIIDDDATSREAIRRLAASMDAATREFESVESFLSHYQGEPGCVVADYRLSGLTGLELQGELAERGFGIPVIIVTSYAQTSLVVKAIQAGAVTMLDKPYDDDELWQAIRNGFAQDAKNRARRQQEIDVERRLKNLTPKERLVLDRILAGMPNKAMARELEVSLRTIENRRRNVFHKLGAGSVAELVAMVLSHRQSNGQANTRHGAAHAEDLATS